MRERRRRDPDGVKEYARNWFKANPEKVRGYRLKQLYGLSQAQYDEMLERQGGVCAICGKPEARVQGGKVKALAVDHDHATEAVRGLLCDLCNRVLGLFEDDPDRFYAAASYLHTSGGRINGKSAHESAAHRRHRQADRRSHAAGDGQ